MVARNFGRYRILGVLKDGGMGRLSLAVMTGVEDFRRIVVLKQILPHLAESDSVLKMFMNEARLAARLDHPNIVHIFELGQHKNAYFMSMEYLPGEDLSRVVKKCWKKKKQIPVTVALTVAKNVAEALHYAHEMVNDEGRPAGLVHRDVSPSNVVMTYYGAIKLLDFGVAKVTAMQNEMVTQVGTFKGKYGYASPEQVRGEKIDARSDIFALGTVMWEMLALRRLFRRQSDAATIRAVEEAAVPSLCQLRPEIPEVLDRIVARALAREKADRFQSASDMADALEKAIFQVGEPASNRFVAQWLTGLFGQEMSDLKQSLAQGRGINLGGKGPALAPHHVEMLGIKPLADEADDGPQVDDLVEEAQLDPKYTPQVEDVRRGAPTRQMPAPTLSSHPPSHSGPPRPNESTAGQLRTAWSIDDPFTSLGLTSTTGGSSVSPGSSSISNSVVPAKFQSSERSSYITGGGSTRGTRSKAGSRRPLLAAIGAGVLPILVLVVLKAMNAGSEPASQEVRLALATQPPGATAYVDGQAMPGVTPTELDGLAPESTVEVRVVKEGFKEEVLKVSLNDQVTKRSVQLRPIALVEFDAVPEGAEVRLDGKRVASFDEPVEVTAGTHEITIRYPSGGEERIQKILRPGKNTISVGE